MDFIPDKPLRGKFAFCKLDSAKYKKYASQYSKAKAGGIRSVYAWMTGAGVVGIIKEFGKTVVIEYGKHHGRKKLAALSLLVSGYLSGPALVMFTKVPKIIKVAKSVHGLTAFCFECLEDSTNLAFVPLDIALFGQLIPVGSSNRFNIFDNHTDFLDF